MPDAKSGYLNACLVFVVALTLFGTANVAAQEKERVSFEKITIPGAFRSAQITDIIQDKYGMLWFSANGLYKYDGYKFTLYKDVEETEIELTGKEITSLYYDSLKERILIGTRNFGILQYRYATNSVTKIVDQKVPIINQITRTDDGTLWAASFNTGIFYSENDTLKKVNYLPNRWSSCLLKEGKKLYVGQLTKIFTIENNVLTDSIDVESFGVPLPTYTRITALFIDKQNKLWIGTEKLGIFVYDRVARKLLRHFDPTKAPFFSRINSIIQDKNGLIWILTKASGLAVYNPSNETYRHYNFNPSSEASISGNNCFSILEDKTGIIWIGTVGDINKYDPRKINFQHVRYNPLSKLSLSDNMVRGVHEDRNGLLWIGTDGGFINLLDRKKNTLEILKVSIPGDPGNYVPMYFTELNDRIMLVGSSLGLLQYDRATKKFSKFQPLWEHTKNKMVRQMLMHKNYLYIICTARLLIYNFKTGDLRNLSQLGDKRAYNISTIHIGSEDRLWVGVREGVSYQDSPDDAFRFIPFEKKTRPDSTMMLVLSVHEFNKKVYAGTFNLGLWEIDISDIKNIPAPKHYSEQDGLQNNTIYSTIPDDDGYLWMSSNSGISKFDPVNKKYVPFTVGEGLQDEEFNRLAFFKNSAGEMIFGGINGINIFDPEEIEIIETAIAPEIVGVMATNPYSDPIVNTYMSAEDNLSLNYDENFVTFQFFVPNFHEPKRYRLLYKLDQFDTHWHEVQADNSASYPNLKPGDYTFVVKTVNLNGDEKMASISFSIVPPIWKTWWFILLAFFVITFFILTIIRSYVRKAQFDKQRLEGLLRVRTSEIEHSREELRALNQKKDLIFSILSHDLRSPLTTLKGFLSILIDNSDMLSKDDVKRHAISIRNSVTNSLDLIDNTLFWSLSQMGNIQYTPTTFQIKPVIEKIIGLYQLTAEKKQIKITLEHEDPSLAISADENMIYVTLRNIISNAIKFTGEGKSVYVKYKKNNDFAEIRIEDEGIGMSADYLNKVLSLDQPMLKKGTSNEKGTGLGLLLCKNFLEMNKGKLQITSVEHSGTTFVVSIPLSTTS